MTRINPDAMAAQAAIELDIEARRDAEINAAETERRAYGELGLCTACCRRPIGRNGVECDPCFDESNRFTDRDERVSLRSAQSILMEHPGTAVDWVARGRSDVNMLNAFAEGLGYGRAPR